MNALTGWLFKTRTSFYQDDSLLLPWWYGVCCWNFALGGALMLWMEPTWTDRHKTFPYRTMAYLLMGVQSPLSFLADYCHMTRDSYWHVVDRGTAVLLMILEVIKFGIVMRDSIRHWRWTPNPHAMPLPLVILYAMALMFAVYSFEQSTQAQTSLDHQGFVQWHTLWHLFPLLASAIVGLDFYGCQGWKRSMRQYFYAVEVRYLMVQDTKKLK
jgi:predicted membrane channel-forming protein YqfA (hemolysin III family)